jgi:hypothetical protein
MDLLMAILALCVLVGLNIFVLKRKRPHAKITPGFIITTIVGILFILGLCYLLKRAL